MDFFLQILKSLSRAYPDMFSSDTRAFLVELLSYQQNLPGMSSA